MVTTEILVAASVALAGLSLLTLKLSLAASSQYAADSDSNKQAEQQADSCGSTLAFLLARFTFWEVLFVRRSKYKLNMLASWAFMAVLNLLVSEARWWGWTLGSILSLMGFLIAEMHIYRKEQRFAEQPQKDALVDWRRPLLYSCYSLFTVVGYCFVGYAAKFEQLNLQELRSRAVNFGWNIGIDQVVARPLILMLLTATTGKTQAMRVLKQQYLTAEARNKERVEAEGPCAPSSPSKLNKNRSPSRVPKAKLSLQPENLIVERKPSIPTSPPRADQDSMVQILEAINRSDLSQFKQQRSEFNTPVRKIKSRTYSNQGDSSLDVIQIGTIERRQPTESADDTTPNRMFRRSSMLFHENGRPIEEMVAPINNEHDSYSQEEWEKEEESRWKFPSLPQSNIEALRSSALEGDIVKKKTLVEPLNLQIHSQEAPSNKSGMITMRLEQQPPSRQQQDLPGEVTIHSQHEKTQQQHSVGGVRQEPIAIESRYVDSNSIGAATPLSKKRSEQRGWLEIEGLSVPMPDEIFDSLPHQSIEAHAIQSIIQGKKGSIVDNYRLISEIREETENDGEADGQLGYSGPQEQYNSSQEEDPIEHEMHHNRSKTLEPAPLRVQLLSRRRESLVLDAQSHLQNSPEQLEEVDLNSPIKKKSNNISPLKLKEPAIERPDRHPTKKKKRNKRDLKDLMKMNGNSPYLQYLPNMLNKEMQQHKKSQQIGPLKSKPIDSRPNKTTRTGELQQKQLDVENIQPEDDIQDFC